MGLYSPLIGSQRASLFRRCLAFYQPFGYNRTT